MSQKAVIKSFRLDDGREVTIETGKLAKQADGAVVVKLGATMILATVVSNKEAKDGVDFLPLTVDYQEKYAATGRFPGGFFRREAKLSDYEVLISRIVDRALRPQFPDDYHADTQVMITLISSDKDVAPDALAGLAASAALTISDIPFNGPISEVRVAKIDGKLQINPTIADTERADIDLIVAGSMKDVVMVEGEMKEVSEEEMISALEIAHAAIKVQVQAQKDLAAQVEKARTKRVYDHEPKDAISRFKKWVSHLGDNHPPVEDRVKLLDPIENLGELGFQALGAMHGEQVFRFITIIPEFLAELDDHLIQRARRAEIIVTPHFVQQAITR